MTTSTILLVEDEMRIARWLETFIKKEGYEFLWASNGTDGLRMALREKPDLVILDINLPEMDGWTVCEKIREKSDLPIIMVTARIAEEDIIRGLHLGADDYVTKPFKPPVLMARIAANLRRAQGDIGPADLLTQGNITVDLNAKEVRIADKSIAITMQQFDLLVFFMRHPNQVFSREQLIDRVFGLDYDSYERAIDIHISRLRGRLKDAGQDNVIQTVYGAGYKFVAND